MMKTTQYRIYKGNKEHERLVENELIKTIRLSGLWKEWFDAGGKCDDGSGKCFFCGFANSLFTGEEYHSDDCIYSRAKALIKEGE